MSPRRSKENNLTDLTRLAGPAAVVLSFDDFTLSHFWAVVGPVEIVMNLRERLLDPKSGREQAMRIVSAPWFPAGSAERHEMAFRALKTRLWEMSESRFEETLQVLTEVKKWPFPMVKPQLISNEQLASVRNLGSFYDLYFPGIKLHLI